MSKIRKAIAAFALAAAGVVVASVTTNGLPADNAGWLALLGAALGVGLAAGLAVYKVPNAPAVRPAASDEDARVRRTY